MAAVSQSYKTTWKNIFKPTVTALASINSPMQCMMKEICAQCLQIQKDPVTGKEHVVYSCAQQDQPLEWVDFKHLHQRLSQNSVHEKITCDWVNFIQSHN